MLNSFRHSLFVQQCREYLDIDESYSDLIQNNSEITRVLTEKLKSESAGEYHSYIANYLAQQNLPAETVELLFNAARTLQEQTLYPPAAIDA